MRRFGRFAAALLGAAAFAAVGGACSAPIEGPRTSAGGDPIASMPPPVSLPTVESTIDNSPSPTDLHEGTIDPAEATFCERMVAYQDAASFGLTGPDATDPAGTRQALEEMRQALTAMRPAAAVAVQGAIDTYAGAVEQLLSLLRGYDYDMSRALQSADADKIRSVIDDPAVVSADRALDAASVGVCGYVPG